MHARPGSNSNPTGSELTQMETRWCAAAGNWLNLDHVCALARPLLSIGYGIDRYTSQRVAIVIACDDLASVDADEPVQADQAGSERSRDLAARGDFIRFTRSAIHR